MEIKVKDGQSLFDIAIQVAGTASAAMDIAVANNLSITGALDAGTVLQVPTIWESAMANYYAANGLTPATEVVTSEEDMPQGIGHWAIGKDFVIS